jgi:hypothetical protein
VAIGEGATDAAGACIPDFGGDKKGGEADKSCDSSDDAADLLMALHSSLENEARVLGSLPCHNRLNTCLFRID